MRPTHPPFLLGMHPNYLILMKKVAARMLATLTVLVITLTSSTKRKDAATKTITLRGHDLHFSLSTHGIQANLCINPIIKHAFPVLEADEEADVLQDATVILPNKKRLTPLSIQLCNTIFGVCSCTFLFKVFFDPGSTVTFICQKCLLRSCQQCLVERACSINTLAGSCTVN